MSEDIGEKNNETIEPEKGQEERKEWDNGSA
jgi:hypothetical protein